MTTEDSPDDHRRLGGRAPRTAPYIPDVPQTKPQPAGEAFPSGALEGSDHELAKLERCVKIMEESKHSQAFEAKRVGLLELIKRYPDRDIEEACSDLEKINVIRYDSKALGLLETFVKKAPRVEPPDQEYTPSQTREIWRLQAEEGLTVEEARTRVRQTADLAASTTRGRTSSPL
jgi:hypothetical protein